MISFRKVLFFPGAFNWFVFNLSETPHVQNCQRQKGMTTLPSLQGAIMKLKCAVFLHGRHKPKFLTYGSPPDC